MIEPTQPPTPEAAPPESVQIEQLLQGRSRDAVQAIAAQAMRALIAVASMAAPEKVEDATAIVKAVLAPELRGRRLTLHTHDQANIKAAVDATIRILQGHQLPGCLVIPVPAGGGRIQFHFFGEGHVLAQVKGLVDLGLQVASAPPRPPPKAPSGIIVPLAKQ